MMPNSADLLAVHFAALQTGLYIVAVNWHLVGPEVALQSCPTAGRRRSSTHERFAAVASAAADEAGLPPSARFAVGEVPGFQPLADLGAGLPPGRPDERTTGAPMLYTFGHHRPPQGRPPAPDRRRPGRRARHRDLVLRHLRGGPARRARAPLRLPALPHRGAELRGHLDPAGPPGRADGQLVTGGDAAAGRCGTG